jgi:hypothetical protein
MLIVLPSHRYRLDVLCGSLSLTSFPVHIAWLLHRPPIQNAPARDPASALRLYCLLSVREPIHTSHAADAFHTACEREGLCYFAVRHEVARGRTIVCFERPCKAPFGRSGQLRLAHVGLEGLLP